MPPLREIECKFFFTLAYHKFTLYASFKLAICPLGDWQFEAVDNSRDIGVETLDAYPDQRARLAIVHLQSLRNELQKLRAMEHFIGATQAAVQFSENLIVGAIVSSSNTNAVLVAILFPNTLFSTRWGRMALFATLRSTIGENLKFTCSKGHVAVARSEARQSLKHSVTAHYSVKTAEYGELIERIKGRERRFVPWKFRMLSTLWYLEL